MRIKKLQYKSRSCKYSRFQLTSNQTSDIFYWTPGMRYLREREKSESKEKCPNFDA